MKGKCLVIHHRSLLRIPAIAMGIVPNTPFIHSFWAGIKSGYQNKIEHSPNVGRVWFRGLDFCADAIAVTLLN